MARSSENLQLGKGEVYFSPFVPGTQVSTGFEWLGNCPAFTLNAEMEKLDHFGSTGGIKQKDQSVMLSKNVTGTITCDDIRPQNIARFIGADVTTLTDAGATGQVYNIADVTPGRRYQVGESNLNPTGDRQITVTTVVNGATSILHELGFYGAPEIKERRIRLTKANKIDVLSQWVIAA